MEWYEILILVVSAVLILAVLQLVYRKIRFNGILKRLVNLVSETRKDLVALEYKPSESHHLEFSDGRKYYIKIIDMNPLHEVIVTNADRVVINDDIKNWRRSTKPHFIPGMAEFFALEKDNKDIVKIVLIYPGCHNITKYINESDAHIVEKFQKVDGLYFIRFGELKEFLEKR